MILSLEFTTSSVKKIIIFSDFMGATYDTSNKTIVGKQRFAPTYKHLNYNIYLFPWFDDIPVGDANKMKVMWVITRTPKRAECIGN